MEKETRTARTIFEKYKTDKILGHFTLKNNTTIHGYVVDFDNQFVIIQNDRYPKKKWTVSVTDIFLIVGSEEREEKEPPVDKWLGYIIE